MEEYIYVKSYQRRIKYYAKEGGQVSKVVTVKQYRRKNPSFKREKYRLTVSTYLYCGHQLVNFEKQKEYSSKTEMLGDEDNILSAIIEEQEGRCSRNPQKIHNKYEKMDENGDWIEI